MNFIFSLVIMSLLWPRLLKGILTSLNCGIGRHQSRSDSSISLTGKEKVAQIMLITGGGLQRLDWKFGSLH